MTILRKDDSNLIRWEGLEVQSFEGKGATAWAVKALPRKGYPLSKSQTSEKLCYIISGKMQFQLGEEKGVLGPGDFCQIPPGVAFSLFNHTLQLASFHLVFTPPRREEEEILEGE